MTFHKSDLAQSSRPQQVWFMGGIHFSRVGQTIHSEVIPFTGCRGLSLGGSNSFLIQSSDLGAQFHLHCCYLPVNHSLHGLMGLTHLQQYPGVWNLTFLRCFHTTLLGSTFNGPGLSSDGQLFVSSLNSPEPWCTPNK